MCCCKSLGQAAYETQALGAEACKQTHKAHGMLNENKQKSHELWACARSRRVKQRPIKASNTFWMLFWCNLTGWSDGRAWEIILSSVGNISEEKIKVKCERKHFQFNCSVISHSSLLFHYSHPIHPRHLYHGLIWTDVTQKLYNFFSFSIFFAVRFVPQFQCSMENCPGRLFATKEE